MNLNFVRIDKRGTDDEYILFKASDNCQLHDFLIHDDTFDSEGDLSNKLRHMYRFPRLNVKKGEYVALYVKKPGKYSVGKCTSVLKIEHPCHILHWGTNTNIFNQDGDYLYLLKIAETDRITIR